MCFQPPCFRRGKSSSTGALNHGLKVKLTCLQAHAGVGNGAGDKGEVPRCADRRFRCAKAMAEGCVIQASNGARRLDQRDQFSPSEVSRSDAKPRMVVLPAVRSGAKPKSTGVPRQAGSSMERGRWRGLKRAERIPGEARDGDASAA